MSDLLAEITVQGTVYRVSKKGLAGQYFYHPFVVRMPTLELGQVEDSGKIGVKFGFITLTNEPTNPEHPFGLRRYNSLFSVQQLFPCVLRWGEAGRILFEGQIFLQTITEKEISFALTDKTYELGARPFSLTESFVFVERIRVFPLTENTPVKFIAPNHPFQTGQIVTFEKMTVIGSDVEYTPQSYDQSLQSQDPDSDNYYIIDSTDAVNIGGSPVSAFTIQNKRLIPVVEMPSDVASPSSPYTEVVYSSDGYNHRVGFPQRVPFSWGVIQHKTPVLKKKSNEVANPSLELNNPDYPIEVSEDGVLIFSTSSASSEYYNPGISLSGAYTQSSGSTEISITITSHGLATGRTINVSFTTGSAISGVYTVTSVVSSSVFTVTAGSGAASNYSGSVTVTVGIAPTATTITLNRNTFQGTTLSISGKSNRAAAAIPLSTSSTLSEFFTYVANQFGFSYEEKL